MKTQSVVIIGSGPAAYTAAIYTARALLRPVVFEGFLSGVVGGQLMSTTDIENFPGFPEPIAGSELMRRMREQAVRCGAELLTEDVMDVDCSARPFLIQGSITTISAHSVIVATGATAKRLNIKGTRDGELWQKGVSACAVCDGAMPLFRNRELFVIGGGDSAVEEALFLTRYASHVYMVHRRDELRASKIMRERALSHPKITVLWNSVIEEVLGDSYVRSVSIRNVLSQEVSNREAAGVFFAVGHQPNTSFLRNQVRCSDLGYIEIHKGSCGSSIEGIYAAGDVQDHVYRQAITAAGSGCMAAIEVERELLSKGVS